MSFKDFNFKTFIQEALDEIKFKEPTPVQQKLIPVVLSLIHISEPTRPY